MKLPWMVADALSTEPRAAQSAIVVFRPHEMVGFALIEGGVELFFPAALRPIAIGSTSTVRTVLRKSLMAIRMTPTGKMHRLSSGQKNVFHTILKVRLS